MAYGRVVAQCARDEVGIFQVAVHPHAQRLDAADQKERVKRPQHATCGVLYEGDAVSEVLVPCHHKPCDDVGVTTEVFGGAVDDDVRAQLQRALEVGRHERIVHDG